MKDLIFQQNFLNLLLFPFLYINKEFQAICIYKRTIRSFVRVFITSMGLLIAIGMFFSDSRFSHFFNGVTSALGIPADVQPVASLYLSIFSVGTAAALISRTITKLFCHIFFGDTDFYLTEKRAQELEEIFKTQGYPVTKATIYKVVNFCIKNLRKPPVKEAGVGIGSCPYDWKRVLDALIFEGDLEVFIEQQEFLQKRLRITSQKCRALIMYGSTFDLDVAAQQNMLTANAVTGNAITGSTITGNTIIGSAVIGSTVTGYGTMNSPSTTTTNILSKTIIRNQKEQSSNHALNSVYSESLLLDQQLRCTIEPPLQISQPAEFGRVVSQDSSALASPPNERTLAVKAMAHFTRHCKHHNRYELLFYCANQLKKRELQIIEGIFPCPLSPNITPLPSPDSNSPDSNSNSEKGSENSSQDAICHRVGGP
jgi:hypothetical protein